LIVSHNHPSGCLDPSPEDLIIKEKIKEVGELLEIKLLDFIIFNNKEYFCIK
jgi:DNA repair protein RadC